MSLNQDCLNLDKKNESTTNKFKWPNKIEDYNLLDLIGSGTFGRVFRSLCKNNSKECAIKCISKQNSPNINKILSEVYIHIRLEHENVLQLFTVLEDNKAVYLIMELCHGGSLSKVISNEVSRRKCANIALNDKLNPILPYPMVSSVILQLCHALEYLHRNSIVHRDINLNNILLLQPLNLEKKNGRCQIQIKLADFGLAIDNNMISDDNLLGTTICGTPGFISPEVWNKKQNASYKSDIFSLGSIIISLIIGHIPKCHIKLDQFLPMAANLIAQLLEHNPEKRPELKQIIQHIFISGRIDTKYLFPVEKITNTLKMSIDKCGVTKMHFIKNNLTLIVEKDGLFVNILKNDNTKRYNFYELPEKYWKFFIYITRFVNLVKSKTSKITINCSDLFKTEEFEQKYINKCILMVDGNFEFNLYDKILNENTKFLLDNNLDVNFKKYENKLYELRKNTLSMQQVLSNFEQEFGINLFPVTFGLDLEQQFDNSTTNMSFLTSQILQSIPINGVGYATQFTNGSIKVNFNDGSDLCMDTGNQIFYLQNGVLKKFNIDESLPEMVVNKIAQLPQVIECLKLNT